MRRIVTRTFWTVLFTLAAFALPAFADSQIRIVRLSYLNGSVQIDRNTGDGFERAIMNMPVTQGAQLRTQDGQAEVEFENGSTVRLSPEAQVVFDGLTLREDGSKLSTISLQKGVAYFDLNHKDKNEFRVQVAGRDIELKKSAHFRLDMSHDQVRLAVFAGDVSLAGPGKQIAVKKKETFSFDPANQAQYALNKGIDEYQFDAWDQQREKYQDQYARVSYSRGPYYGWSDLNYYGAFSYVPGWGNMWRPFGVGYGWDPFAVGYWAWYPWGYTWVSPYAWGWTPYRYGGWNFVPGYGWGWMPGSGRHNAWQPLPPVRTVPPGWRPPQPPSGTRGGIVVIGHPHPVPTPPVTRSFNENDHGAVASRARRSTLEPLPTPNVMTGTAMDQDRSSGRVNGTRPGTIQGTTPASPSNRGAFSPDSGRGRHERPMPPNGTRALGGSGTPNSGASTVGDRSSGMGASGAGPSRAGGSSMGNATSTHGGSGAHSGGSNMGRNPR